MSWEDFLISALLLLSIARYLRGRRLTWVSLAWPVGLVTYAGMQYLSAIPARGNDLLFVAALSLTGLTLGLGCGLLSRVWLRGERVMARATGMAAVMWVVGIGMRIIVGIYAGHGGGPMLTRISADLGLTSYAAWSTGLIMMSLLEVLGRTGVLTARMLRARHEATLGATGPRDPHRTDRQETAP